MDREELWTLIAEGETLAVEFKSDLKKAFNDDRIVENAVCLANSPQGGCLLIGVEDDGTITGARPRHGETTDPIRLQVMVANRTVPQVVPRVEVVDVEGKDVICIKVEPDQQSRVLRTANTCAAEWVPTANQLAYRSWPMRCWRTASPAEKPTMPRS